MVKVSLRRQGLQTEQWHSTGMECCTRLLARGSLRRMKRKHYRGIGRHNQVDLEHAET